MLRLSVLSPGLNKSINLSLVARGQPWVRACFGATSFRQYGLQTSRGVKSRWPTALVLASVSSRASDCAKNQLIKQPRHDSCAGTAMESTVAAGSYGCDPRLRNCGNTRTSNWGTDQTNFPRKMDQYRFFGALQSRGRLHRRTG